MNGFAYTPPFFLSYDHAPAAVMLVRVRRTDQPSVSQYPKISPVEFEWKGTQIKVSSLYNFTLGVRYDLTFEVIG